MASTSAVRCGGRRVRARLRLGGFEVLRALWQRPLMQRRPLHRAQASCA